MEMYRGVMCFEYADFVANALISKMYYKVIDKDDRYSVSSKEILLYSKVICDLLEKKYNIRSVPKMNYNEVIEKYSRYFDFDKVDTGTIPVPVFKTKMNVTAFELTNKFRHYPEDIGMVFVEPSVLETIGIYKNTIGDNQPSKSSIK